MDADAVITRFNVDVRSIIKPDKDLYMVQHEYNGKDNPIPNSGFLVIRNTSWSKKLLEEIWQKKEYINHKWWENAALIDIMGYKNLVGGVRNLNHEMLAKVEFISSEWNYLPMLEVVAEPIVTHFAGMSRDDRLSLLPKTAMQAIQKWTENAYPKENDARPAGYPLRLALGVGVCLSNVADVAACKRPGFLRRLERSFRKRRERLFGRIGFDREWYLQEYPDVGFSGIDPLDHYVRFGIEGGRWKSRRHKEEGLASGTLREKRPGFFGKKDLRLTNLSPFAKKIYYQLLSQKKAKE